MPETPRVFISYSSSDEDFARRLIQSLKAQNFVVESDQEIQIGDDYVRALLRMREDARFIIPVMSPAYFSSPWTTAELDSGLQREQKENRVVVLPALYKECLIPNSLRTKLYADFRRPSDYDRTIRRLAAAMQADSATDLDSYNAPQLNQPPTPVEFPDDLVEQINGGNCVLYAGSGLSAPAGLPTWQQFAEQLVRASADSGFFSRFDLEFFRSALRDRKMDYVVDEIVGRSPEAFIQKFLIDTFLGKTPPDAHQVVSNLPFAAALTTNFDDLLEQTFRTPIRSQGAFTPQDTESLLTAFTRRDFFVLKLYGSLDRPASVLVSPAQFERAISENLPFQNFMESLFVSRTILFVGCSLEGIEAYLRGLRFRTQLNSRHYALAGVLGTTWEAMAGVLERRYGIHTIPYRDADVADQLHALRELAERVGRTAVSLPKHTVAARLKKIELTNIGPFEHEEITVDPRTNILLGNNGVGKSTILRAIAVALCGKDAEQYAARLIRSGALGASIQLETERQSYTTILQKTSTGVELTSLPIRALDAEGWLALAFPPLRGVSSSPGGRSQRDSSPFPTVNDVLPLARGDADLRLDELQQWIADLDYRAKHEQSTNSGNTRYERLIQAFFDAVTHLLEGVKVEFQSVDPATKRITVLTDDGPVPFDYVSQGTLSLISWVGILLQRIYEIYGDDENPAGQYVLVLMDEIDAHMHPTWQQVLLPRLLDLSPICNSSPPPTRL